jgi:hypothetical protein
VNAASPAAQRRYRAFISYSHAVDGKLAPALQTGLERFAKPWYRLRAFRVFRDKTGLAVTPGLWPSIERALESSEYFVLLASPAGAASEWVQREIQHWLDRRSPDTLLIVLTDGELEWDDAAGDFDWSRTTALPRLLERRFSAEPNYLDLRWARADTDLSVRRPRFLDAVASLASTLRQVPLDDLIGEDIAHFRTTRRLLRGGVAALLVLTVSAFYAAYQANQARTIAGLLESERARAIAEQQAAADARARQAEADRLAEEERERTAAASRNVAFAAAKLPPNERDLAILLASEAVQISPTPEATDLLRRLLVRRTPPLVLYGPDDLTVTSTTFSPDGRRLLAVFEDASVRWWNLAQPGTATVLANESVKDDIDAIRAAFSPDGSTVLTAPNPLLGTFFIRGPGAARLWDANTGTLRHALNHDALTYAAFSPDGSRVVTTGGLRVVIWDSASGKMLSTLEDHEREVVHVDFSRDGKWLYTTAKDDTIRIRNAADGAPVSILRVPGKTFLAGALLSPDNRWLLTVGIDDPLRLWAWHGMPGTYTAELAREFSDSAGADFSPDAKTLLTVDRDTSARLWDVATGRNLHELTHDDSIGEAVFNADGRWVLTASVDGTAVLWDASTGRRMMEFGGYDRSRTTASFSPDGARVATGTAFGQVLVHPCEICGSVEDLLTHARSRVARQLTADEKARYLLPENR